MRATCDLCVVGGSFAGLMVAHRAASQGLSVIVLDKKKGAGEHVRTTGILTHEARTILEQEVGEVPALLHKKIAQVRLYAPNLSSVDLAEAAYTFSATDTPHLLEWLAEKAVARGARLSWCSKVIGISLVPSFGYRVVVQDAESIFARYLVGADGFRSMVARQCGLAVNTSLLYGVEWECAESEGVDPRFLHVFLDSALAPGYIGWVVPGVGVTQVGIARSDRLDLRAFSEFRSKVSDLLGLTHLREVRAGCIPSGGPLKRVGGSRAMLVGDAAGLVSPLTAGGIKLSFKWGIAVADMVARYLRKGEDDPSLTLVYPRYRKQKWLRRGLELRPPNFLLNTVVHSMALRSRWKKIFYGPR